VSTETVTAYIGIGSNLGDRAGNLLLAVRGLLEASIEVTKLSAVYETEPVGIESDQNFLNMAAEARVRNITSSQLMARLLRIEYLLGRRDKSLKKPRTVDLDLLFFGSQRLDSPFLTVPHPRLHQRRFVLIPMAEIAPHFVHPGLRKEIRELLVTTEDTSHVTRWNPMHQGVAVPTAIR
jgi:2-amino-4-hydroxy-6-hydroxymethyldihydropteridine diphosphokinase